jgi:hypothetical protein
MRQQGLQFTLKNPSSSSDYQQIHAVQCMRSGKQKACVNLAACAHHFFKKDESAHNYHRPVTKITFEPDTAGQVPHPYFYFPLDWNDGTRTGKLCIRTFLTERQRKP